MKKLSLALLVFILGGLGSVTGQTKIGVLTVDSSTFYRYLHYCHSHPDSIPFRYEWWDCLTGSYNISLPLNYEEAERNDESYNEGLLMGCVGRYSKGKECADGVLVPHKPSEQDFIIWLKKYKK